VKCYTAVASETPIVYRLQKTLHFITLIKKNL